MLFCFVHLAHLNVGDPNVLMSTPMLWVQGKRLFIGHKRFIVFFLIAQAVAQQVKTVCVSRVANNIGF